MNTQHCAACHELSLDLTDKSQFEHTCGMPAKTWKEAKELSETRHARVRALAAVMYFSNMELDMFRNKPTTPEAYMKRAAEVIDTLDRVEVPPVGKAIAPQPPFFGDGDGSSSG